MNAIAQVLEAAWVVCLLSRSYVFEEHATVKALGSPDRGEVDTDAAICASGMPEASQYRTRLTSQGCISGDLSEMEIHQRQLHAHPNAYDALGDGS